MKDPAKILAATKIVTWPPSPPEPAANAVAKPLPLTWVSEIGASTEYPRQLIGELLEQQGTGVIYGASGSGKSTLAVDIAICIAAGLSWNGRETLQGLAGIVAAEAAESTWRRIRAKLLDSKIDPCAVNLAVHDGAISFDPAAIDQLIATLRAESEKRGLPVRLVLIDTLASNEGGKEDSEHFERVGAALGQIRDGLGCQAIVVHHAGKNLDAGMRGHTSLYASVDLVLEVNGVESVRSVLVTKSRDGVAGQGWAFRLDPVTVGFREPDAAGVRLAVTAPVIRYEGAAKRQKPKPREGHQTRALDALRINARETGASRWTIRQASDLLIEYHGKVKADHERPLLRTYPVKIFRALAAGGHVVVDNGFVALGDEP